MLYPIELRAHACAGTRPPLAKAGDTTPEALPWQVLRGAVFTLKIEVSKSVLVAPSGFE